MSGTARGSMADVPDVADVAIVGCGPVGATLAILLAQHSVDVVVVEREQAIYPLPRAIHFDGECMRVFQAAGIAAALAAHVVVSPGMRFVDASGRLLIDWTRPTSIGPQGWHPSYRFHQPTLEGLLRARLGAFAGARSTTGHAVVSIEQDTEAATLELVPTAGGPSRALRARWVVGCDGARSTVRRTMPTTLDDLQSHERWLVVDVLLDRERPDLGDHSVQYCDPARPATYVRGVGERRRWELMLRPDEDAVDMMRPANVWSLLERWITPAEASLERPAVYTFHSVVARGWRDGRKLIAGDAAHQTPPFMGQGLCAGIRDASNLAWKLAAVVAGRASESLLDSYESERAPHVRTFVETAVRLGRVIQATDAEQARRRDEAFAAGPQVFATPQPPLGPGAHLGAPLGGRLAEQPLFADGTRLDDVVGPRFALLTTPALAEAARRATVGLDLAVIDHAVVQPLLATRRTNALLVRPDRYVVGGADDAAGLARLVGHVPAPSASSSKDHRREETSACASH